MIFENICRLQDPQTFKNKFDLIGFSNFTVFIIIFVLFKFYDLLSNMFLACEAILLQISIFTRRQFVKVTHRSGVQLGINNNHKYIFQRLEFLPNCAWPQLTVLKFVNIVVFCCHYIASPPLIYMYQNKQSIL